MTDREPPLSAAEREEIIDLYEGLRVTDVVDGLDYSGFWNDLHSVSKEIGPLYRDVDSFSHRVSGFANTHRFLPTNKPRDMPNDLDFETATEWRNDWYGDLSGGPSEVREHDVIVVEAHELDVGIIGSANALAWTADGANGVLTNGGPRDTDELIKQGIPVYSKDINKPIIPGRCEFDAEQIPVNVGGCLIRPGDFIVADGDGVVVVPIEHVDDVADAARREQQADQEMRAELYEKAGLEHDFTLEQPSSRE
ncbi:dimethylmenaquinone methyltransferase [Halobacteria archaeon AArc-m2/3/4]|uniref:Dimethylmenaquinone methyltransferase n=1 Tax=Natronoglomus mannanivorans TaxID=2979990 RepID=A0ABT2QGP0_9EURY|nr:dimethylmenaquinone methyltransferase [Halobacteria archaeon AArc-m2/3/4]